MAKSETFEQEGAIRLMQRRTLRGKCPLLLRCIEKGMHVLDVGSSSGAMTAEVARVVAPGKVIGIDVAEKAVEEGRQMAAEAGIKNLSFRVADTYDLPFNDGEFDLTYSLGTVVWFRDPVAALIEQKRVTRKGGWVAASIGDWGSQVIFPPSPALERLFVALAHLADDPQHDMFVDFNLGRKARWLFHEAGFADIELRAYVALAEQGYPREGDRESETAKFLRLTDRQGPARHFLEAALQKGLLSPNQLDDARAEAEAWMDHPYTFHFSTTVFARGKVM